MKKMFLICAIVAALACINVMPAQSQSLISLKFNQSDIEVPVCTIFEVDLLADISESDAISGWGLDLLWDPTQMNLDSFIIGTGWTPPSPGTTDDGLAGFLPLSFPPADPVWGNNTLLATFKFHCLNVGFSTLDLAVTPGDLTEGFILAATGDFADWDYTPANITQTPEPATLFLVGTGLAGLAAIRRRKKTR